MKDVYAIYDGKNEKDPARWVRVGVAFDNRDGSVNVLLDAVPLCGRLQLRERLPRPPVGEGGESANGEPPR